MTRDKTDKTDKSPDEAQVPTRYNRGKDGTHPFDKSFQPKPEGVVEELGGDELQRVFVTWGGFERLGKPDDFWNMLEATLAECDEIMLLHGWDRSSKNWPSERTSEPFSDLYYAGKIGFLCWNFLNNHRPNNPNTAMLGQAFRLGCKITEQEWRGRHKPSILTGRDVRKTLAAHRSTAHAKQREGMAARRDAISSLMRESERKLVGNTLERHLQKKLLENFDIKAALRTIRRDVAELSE